MAKLKAKQRKGLPDSSFALKSQRKYPIKTKSGAPDRSHAANAKSRAQQQFDKGKLSKAKLNEIDREANRVLKKTKKTTTKKK